MRKIITLTLEAEIDEAVSDASIKWDLMAEISCCCNYYEMLNFTVEEAADDDG